MPLTITDGTIKKFAPLVGEALAGAQPSTPAPAPAPLPTPAQAGFDAFAADPQHQQRAKSAITPPGLPIFPSSPTPAAPMIAQLSVPDFTGVQPMPLQAQQGQKTYAQAAGVSPTASDGAPFGGAQPMPGAAPAATPQPTATSGNGPAPTPDPRLANVAPLNAATARYNAIADSKAGVDRIHNPFLRTVAKIGDIAGSILVPGVTTFVPGTTLNHIARLNQAGNEVSRTYDQLNAVAKLNDTAAQTQQRQAAADRADQLSDIQRDQLKQRIARQNQQDEEFLAKNGLKRVEVDNGDGTTSSRVVDNRESAAFADRENLRAYRDAIAEKSQVLAENAKNHYIAGTPQYAEAQRKLAQADQKLAIAGGNLGLRRDEFVANNYGRGPDDKPLPGSLELPDGTPVGKNYSGNVKPSSPQLNRADLANSARTNLATMREIRMRRPDLFGPTQGRVSQLAIAIGNQDPDAQRYQNAATTFTDHATAVFGARSKYALEHIGRLTNASMNNAAALAEYDDAERTLQHFQDVGTPHTSGGANDVRRQPARTAPSPKGQVIPPARTYRQTATGPNGHKIGSNDNGATWYDTATGKQVQ